MTDFSSGIGPKRRVRVAHLMILVAVVAALLGLGRWTARMATRRSALLAEASRLGDGTVVIFDDVMNDPSGASQRRAAERFERQREDRTRALVYRTFADRPWAELPPGFPGPKGYQ